MLITRMILHELEERMADRMSLAWAREPSKRRTFRIVLCNHSQRGEAHPCLSEILKCNLARQCAAGSLPVVGVGEELHIGAICSKG